KSCPADWQLRLAVAFALVVLDLDLDLALEILGFVGKSVGILQRLVAFDIGQFVSRQRRLVDLLLVGRRLGRCSRRGCRGGRRRAAAAPDFYEVLTVVLAAALGTFDRALVQVVEARATALAGALRTPARLDHAGTPGNPQNVGRPGRERGRMSRAFHPVKTK